MFALAVSLAIFHLLAVISPGPDFALVIRNASVSSRKLSLFTVIGITLGNMVHISYCFAFFLYITNKESILYLLLMIFGAIYLMYFGVSCLKSFFSFSKLTTSQITQTTTDTKFEKRKKRQFFANGFFTNLLNGKAALYFISIFSKYMSPQYQLSWKIFFITEIVLITFTWFTFVSFVMTSSVVQRKFLSKRKYIDLVFGIVIILFSITMFVDVFISCFNKLV